MKKSIITCACLLIAVISTTSAQWDPLKLCEAWCNVPPERFLAGTLVCAEWEFCCMQPNCQTGQFAGVCCGSKTLCNSGLDPWNDNISYANCGGLVQ